MEKTERSGEKILSFRDMQLLIGKISDTRDRLMLRLLYETGCTISELVGIRVSDVNDSRVTLLDPSVKEKRNASISARLNEDLMLYAKGNGIPPDGYILSTRQSPHISEKRVRQIVQSYTEKCGFGRINPQMFRYYHVAHAYLSGIYQERIAEQLGIKRYRVFKILELLRVNPGADDYKKFLNSI